MQRDDQRRMAIGVDIGGTKVLAGLVTDGGEIVDRINAPTSSLTSKNAAERLSGLVLSLLERNSLPPEAVAGVGIGVPGVIDPDDDVVVSCPNARALEGIELRTEVGRLTGVTSRVENDVNLAALAEHWLYLPGVRDLVFIALGTGIGCGLILDGRLYRGTGAAGELGHMIMREDGPQCACGGRGCLEAFVSGRAIRERYGDLSGSPAGAHATEVFALAEAGDPVASRVLTQALDYLVLALANVANLLAPEVIVLGGGLGLAREDLLFPSVPERVKGLARQVIAPRLRVVKAAAGVEAGLLGAARLVLDDGPRS